MSRGPLDTKAAPRTKSSKSSSPTFRSGGWPSALRKGIEVDLAQRKAKTDYVSPYGIAQLYANLGDKDHAFEWFNTAYQEHDAGLMALRTDFTLDSLRSDPRYAELVRKIGLPQ